MPELLPLALGVAVSPIPILAVIIMVLADRSRSSSWAFALGWIVGVALACALCIPLSGVIQARDSSVTAAVQAAFLILLGVAFLVLAALTWRRRPRDGQVPRLPRWLGTVDRLDMRRAAGLGLFLAVLNPKNLVILPVAGSTIARSGLAANGQVAAVFVFTCVAASTVVVPVLAYTVARPSVAGPLAVVRGWLLRSSHAVVALLASVIAALLFARGISELL